MTTAIKPIKEKPYINTPKLLPRPTAASAARAARNATNRNLTLQLSQRQSPIRASSSPSNYKVGKNVGQRQFQKIESTTNIKDVPVLDNDLRTDNHNGFKNMESYSTRNSVDENVKYSGSNNLVVRDFNETDMFEEISNRRPATPAMSSRPQTPIVQSSRPQTPRIRSRPTTPTHAPARSTPTSRPNTPQYSISPRPKTPSSLPATVCNRAMTYSTPLNIKQRPSSKEDGDIKSTYISKRKLFHNLKKELDLKQQAVLEVFECLKALHEQLSNEGKLDNCGDDFMQKELVVFSVSDWSAEEVARLCHDALASSTGDEALNVINTIAPIEEGALSELESKIINVPACFADLCLQAFTARQEIIDWIKNIIEGNEITDSSLLEKIAHYNTQGLEFCEALRNLKTSADDAVDATTRFSKRAIQERSTLLTVGESLVRKIESLKHDLEERASIVKDMREIHAESKTVNDFEEIRRELEEERSARIAMKDKLSNSENQLRQARGRVTKMDRQLREAEASIVSLTGTVKALEEQSRQREVQLEARARKLKESLKTGEVASNHLSQQRDALQNEVSELKEQIEKMTSEYKSNVQSLNDQLKELKNTLEEKSKLLDEQIGKTQIAEKALIESQNIIEDLRTKITESENNKPNPDLPTEREIELWAELQATKDTLRMTEEEVSNCKKEKVHFLESLTKIAESDNKVGLQQKLAAELLSKEEILGKMAIQIRELTKNIKYNEQKVVQYEQYVSDLQAHNRAVSNCNEAPNGPDYQELQQEIMNLRMSLLDAVNRNEELSEVLSQKDQQLEQQDKTARTQARVIKVREELINMLKNKESEQSRELSNLQQDLEHRMKIVDEVNKQIASKAVEIQELFATLDKKQQQIHRLEKIVLALEEQQRRAQAQRTRHEEKIAALEHELAAGGIRRERKFLFF